MAEHDHQHHHHHDDGRFEDHVADPAGRSLSEALRLSFRVLTVVMVLVFGAFLATGFENIKDNQIGLIKVFGKIVGRAEPGLAFGWPFPIGEIELVSTAKQTVEIDDFWFHLQSRDMAKEIDEISTQQWESGLDPKRDGALLTGDRSLYHVRLTVTWEVSEAIAYKQNVSDADMLVRDAVVSGAIRIASGRTGESIQREGAGASGGGFGPFAPAIQQLAQADLDQIEAGIRITNIAVDQRTWPLVARRAYTDAQRASDEKELKISQARREAIETLRASAGTVYARLVGEPGQPLPPSDWNQAYPYDLIGQYNRIQESVAGDAQAEAELLQRIGTVLASRDLGGQAQSIIAQAQSSRATIEQIVQQRADRFRKLLPRYKNPKTRGLLLTDLWSESLEKLAALPMLEAQIAHTGSSVPYVVYLPPSEEAAKRINAAKTRARNEQGE